MNILFISYTGISLAGGNVRAVAMLYALADAGHRVDVLAPVVDLPDHPHIRRPVPSGSKPLRGWRLRLASLRMTGRTRYDAVHAMDAAVFHAMRLSRLRGIPLVYDAQQRFSRRAGGIDAQAGGGLLRGQIRRLEAAALQRAAFVFSSCSALTNDLRAMEKRARLIQIEDIPLQSLHSGRYADKTGLSSASDRPADYSIVCVVLAGCGLSLRTPFIAARELLEAEPRTTVFFRGVPQSQLEKISASLDIADRCQLLAPDEPEAYLSALENADAILMLPSAGSRYIDSQLYTLLQAGVPLVTIHEAAYDELLDEINSVSVLPSPEAIAEGVLRVIHEPLFSLAIALEGQQRVTTRYTLSSFKHKVRMAYREMHETGHSA